MFQTTNQLLLFTANLDKLNRYTNNIPTYIHISNMINIIQLHTLGVQFQWLMHKHSCRDHIPTYVFFSDPIVNLNSTPKQRLIWEL